MAIQTSPFNGSDLFVRDNQWASQFFGGQGGTFTNSPKHKHNWGAGFTLTPTARNPSVQSAGLGPLSSPFGNSVSRDQLGIPVELGNTFSSDNPLDYYFLVKGFEPPKMNIDTDVVNQYNKKRVVQKKISYQPVVVRFHDDQDSKIVNLVNNYLNYHYKDFSNNIKSDWTLDTARQYIKSNNWGLINNSEKYFFLDLHLFYVNGGRVTLIYLMNPVITDITHDALSYEDGGVLEISLTFAYEGIYYHSINAPLLEGIDSAGLSGDSAFLQDLYFQIDGLGSPFVGPDPALSVFGSNRTPGLGEIFNTASTFYGKYNGKPSIKDAVKDFIIRPAAGSVSGGLNSWGNFNFGGVPSSGTTASGTGALNSIANPIGSAVNTVGNIFRFGG